jgi:hypothetical protein
MASPLSLPSMTGLKPFASNTRSTTNISPSYSAFGRDLVEKYWSSQNEASQVKSVREIFKMSETDAAPLEFVNKLIDYFDWCSHTRNQFMHSEQMKQTRVRDKALEVREMISVADVLRRIPVSRSKARTGSAPHVPTDRGS